MRTSFSSWAINMWNYLPVNTTDFFSLSNFQQNGFKCVLTHFLQSEFGMIMIRLSQRLRVMLCVSVLQVLRVLCVFRYFVNYATC